MRLAHLHLSNLIPFAYASLIQQTLVSRLLAHKRLCNLVPKLGSSGCAAHPPPPDPTIFTFTPYPVYTTGRRDFPDQLPDLNTSSGSHDTTSSLQLPAPLEPVRHLLVSSPPVAEYYPTLRGGQTTYHGPGQLVAYTIFDLRRLRIGPRAHIRLLEESVIDVLRDYGVRGTVGDDPGVWIPANGGSHNSIVGGVERIDDIQGPSPPKKIAAVGVHLRRYVSSYGVGLNVTDEPIWFFRQIVACGLDGREATSLAEQGVRGVGMGQVADGFVRAFVERVSNANLGPGLGPRIEEVYKIEERDVVQVD